MSKFDNVSVVKKANVYFDGKCVSHTVQFADSSRKSVGVIFPSKLTFKTGEPEMMEIIAGSCRVKLADAEPRVYRAGESFKVAGNSAFDIEALETLDYVCHFG
jgi:purine/pyrimidine-nucleoside phosphorylase